jgi:hypothetical protein
MHSVNWPVKHMAIKAIQYASVQSITAYLIIWGIWAFGYVDVREWTWLKLPRDIRPYRLLNYQLPNHDSHLMHGTTGYLSY